MSTDITRGTLGTYSIGSDSYPAVVTHASASGKTVYVRTIRGIRTEDRTVGHGHESTDVIADPESVERALALPPKSGEVDDIGYERAKPMKFMLRDSGYRGKGGHGRFTPGIVRSKMDPHF